MRPFPPVLSRAPAALIALGYAALAAWVILIHFHLALTSHGASLAASDPPAHFTSGVMVYDYLREGLGAHPIRYAESYYVRYPKVAIGHWPPAYYGIQAAWYCLFGPTVNSALALSAATAAAIGLILFRRLKPYHGAGVAAGAALVFLALPWIQRAAWAVMSDLLTGLFVFLALLALSDLLEAPRSGRAALRFSLWSVLAVLTKGTAWALGPFALLAPLLARRMGCFLSWRYWAAGIAIVALGAPFYVLMGQSQMGYPAANILASGGGFAWAKHLAPLQALPNLAQPWIWALAAIGLAACALARWKRADPSPEITDGLVAGAWALAQALFLFLLPLTTEPRAYAPALAPLALLLARSLSLSALRWNPAVPLALAGLLVFGAGEIQAGRVDGYRDAAQAIPFPPEGTLMMIASDPAGEGAFIVERLMEDERRAGVVLRAGQWLEESNWNRTRHEVRFEDAEQVRQALRDLPVSYVLIDDSAANPDDTRLLRQAVEEAPREFPLIGRFPVWDSLGGRSGAIRAYENPAAGDRHPGVLRVRLGMERGGRVLEYPWGNSVGR